MVCSVFTCDNVEQLAAHLQIDRTKIREDEVLSALGGTFICKLCPYKTSLKANFQLHCKTDKHLQRLQQVNHIKEGGPSNEWKLKHVNVSNPVQLRCNFCDYYTNSLHKLQLHLTNDRHLASECIFVNLKNDDQLLRANDSDLKQTSYRCELCSISYSTIFALLHHLNSTRHVQSENLRQIKNQIAISQGMTMKKYDEIIRELFTCKRGFDKEDLENDNQTDLQSKSTINNLNQMLCPLCQSQFTLRANLQQHIIDTHNVTKEGVEKLMSIVDSVKENNVQTNLNNSPLSPSNKSTSQLNNSLNSNHSALDNLDNNMDFDDDTTEPLKANNTDRHLHKFRCNQCPLSFRTADKLAIHSQYHKIRAASQCVLCGKTTRSIESMQKHMEVCHKEMNEQELDTYRLSLVNNPFLISLKNGCQGVLDPATTELLKRESNRDLDLQQIEHLNGNKEDSLDEQDDEDFENENLNDTNNTDNLDENEEFNNENNQEDEQINELNKSQQNNSNEEYLNSQNVAEDSYNDPTRKYKCHRCRVAYTRQSYLSAHNKTLYHRKGEKLTYPMEKYLDPNRPFKCEMCKESFTQKNILMTHYNSVSHLHRLNQAMKESLNQNPSSKETVSNETNQLDESAYKCNICKLSFNNGAILDNHIQSAQHQNRVSKLPQLAISGQIDLNKPLVERPDDSNNKLTNDDLNIFNELQLLQQINSNNNQQSQNLNCSQCSMSFNNQESLSQHQQICFLLNAVNKSNNGSSQINNLDQLLKQQQQLNSSNNKLYNASLSKSKPPVYKHLLETWGYEIVQQFNEHHQRRKKLKLENGEEDTEMDIDELNNAINNELIKQLSNQLNNNEQINNEENDKIDDEENKDDNQDETNNQENNSQEENDEDLKTENNEQSNTELNNEEETSTSNKNEINEETLKLILNQDDEEDQEEKKENDPNTTNNLTDANKFKCDTCLKEFSSIWVLKAHKEEVHKDVVKMQTVQDFAEIYRKEFERKNNIVVKSVVLENETSLLGPNNSIAAQQTSQSADLQQNSETSANNDSDNNSSMEQQSSANDSNKIDNSSQLTNNRSDDLNNSTNSNSNNNSSNNNSINLLANNPALANSNNPLANNALLTQAFAQVMQQQSQSNNPNTNNMEELLVNQMALLQQANHMQGVNQLLGLAGAMSNNSNNAAANTNSAQNQQQQAAQLAAMTALLSQGLPPQMLPILMAGNASSANDPMMNLFANPLLAAQNPLANPLAGLLSGMTPDAMMAGLLNPAMASALNNSANNIGKSPNASLNSNVQTNNQLPIIAQSTTPTTPLPVSSGSNNAGLLNTAQSLQAAANAAANSNKRARTRISDDQLKILRKHFDINNSPTEEALLEMENESGLPLKVIKHWFRNTLFKERQRNKDSPYNFNNPPSTYLNLEEYEKTGETKVQLIDDKEQNKEDSSSQTTTPAPSNSGKTTPVPQESSSLSNIKNENEIKSDSFNSSDDEKSIKQEPDNNQNNQNIQLDSLVQQHQNATNNLQQILAAMAQSQFQQQLNGLGSSFNLNNNLNKNSLNEQQLAHNESMKSYNLNSNPHSDDSMDSIGTNDTSSQPNMQIYSGLQFANLPGMPPISNSLQLALQNSQLNPGNSMGLLSGSNSSTPSAQSTPNTSSNPGKRANRTRFTDYQIRVLQEFFESNAYPKDDDLDYLSKLLGLSPRVIVVWFQNARQKARKVYENQPPSINDGMPGTPTMPPASTTPNAGLNLTPPCTTPNSATSSNSATPNPLGQSANSSTNPNAQRLSYNCKKCMQSFQRYYELIKHQKNSCFKDENPVAVNTKNAKQADDGLNNSLSSNDFNTSSNQNSQAAIQNGTFQCDKCSMSFDRLNLFQEHRVAHFINPNLFANLQTNNNNLNNSSNNGPFGNMLNQFEAAVAAAQSAQSSASPALSGKSPSTTPLPLSFNNDQGSSSPTPQQNLLIQQQLLQLQQLQQAAQFNKRKFSNEDDDDCDSQSGDGSQCSGGNRSAISGRDKRLRTTILPEQLEYLHQKYRLESNPSRKMLEAISEEVGLKKRVVQVWFQNCRARERKGQLKVTQQSIHKRCPFCRALFKVRAALESHLATRHADQYTKGEIDIDALPDSDSEQSMSEASALNNALNLANSLAGLDNGDGSANGNLNNVLNSLLANNLLGNVDSNPLLQDNLNGNEQLRQLFSNMSGFNNISKFMNLNDIDGNDANNEDQEEEENDDESMNNAINNNNESSSTKKKGEFALDLSKPLDLS